MNPIEFKLCSGRQRILAGSPLRIALLLVLLSALSVPQTLQTSDGTNFPDHAISLIYDDGPDVNSLALAEYLKEQHVSATFDVAGAFIPLDNTGYLNNNPGYLSSLITLGHRLSNHTRNHGWLDGQDPEICTIPYDPRSGDTIGQCVQYQVDQANSKIAPYVTNKLFMLMPPGDHWIPGTSDSWLLADTSLPSLVRLSPVFYGLSTNPVPAGFCGNASSAKVSVNADDWCYASIDYAYPNSGWSAADYASDFLNAINQAGHGFAINHDRNAGQVGSAYTLNVAQIIVPALQAQGYVFVAPVLVFSSVTSYPAFAEPIYVADPSHYDTFRAADINGDGHTDVCARNADGIYCSLSQVTGLGNDPSVSFAAPARWEGTQFTDANGWTDSRYASTIQLADVNGDGKADLIARNGNGILVALSNGSGFNSPIQWSSGIDFSDLERDSQGQPMWLDPSRYATFRVADIDGDGKADICAKGEAGIVCAISTGAGFIAKTLWETSQFTPQNGWNDGSNTQPYSTTIQLADVDADGKADLIARNSGGILVALSSGTGFKTPSAWSVGLDFSNSETDSHGQTMWLDSSRYSTFRAGDINGDGKADVCARSDVGMVCALSTGNKLLNKTVWEGSPNQTSEFTDTNGWNDSSYASTIMIGDVNGDSRVDIFAKNSNGLVSMFAP